MVTSTYCLNPDCKENLPNPFQANFCQKCGSKLLLNNRYRAIKNLGGGGFGTAFLASNIRNDEFCVIKVLHCLTPKTQELFEREANQLKELGNHPQIPQFLDYFEEDLKSPNQNQLITSSSHKYLFLIQEYIEGQPLSELVKKNKNTFNEEQIRGFLTDILPTIKFIHEHDIIHRDVKPANIIRRNRDGKFVLIDFGSVKEFNYTNIGQTATGIYTLGYAANEHIKGKAIPASDIYSIGVTCIYLLTGIEPSEIYDSYNDCLSWRESLKKEGVILTKHLEKILEKLLQPLARDRYQSADEVLLELLPDITIDQHNLSIKINHLGEKVSQKIRITNSIPYSLLQGTWLLDNDLSWLSITPKSFKGNDIQCLIEINSIHLSANSSYVERIPLRNNSRIKNIYINIEVKTPEVKLSNLNIILKASKLDEVLTQTVTLFNTIPDAILQGSWHIYPSNLQHDWISIIPQQSNQNAECTIRVDTSQLKSNTKFERQIELQSHLLPKKYLINLHVETAHLGFQVIPYLALLSTFVLASVGTFSIVIYSMYLAKDSGWSLSSLTDQLKIFEWTPTGFWKQFIWLCLIILSGWTAFPRVSSFILSPKRRMSISFVPGVFLVSFAVVVAIIGSLFTSKYRTIQPVFPVLIFMVCQAFLMSLIGSFGILIIWIISAGINFLASEFKRLKYEFQKINLLNSISQKILQSILFGVRLIFSPIIIALIITFTVILISLFLVIYMTIFQKVIMPLLSYSAEFIGIDRITGLDFLIMGISSLLIELAAVSFAIIAKNKIIKKINPSIMPIILSSLIIFGIGAGILVATIAGIYFSLILIPIKVILLPLISSIILSGTVSISLLFYLSLQQKKLLQHYKNIECSKIQR